MGDRCSSPSGIITGWMTLVQIGLIVALQMRRFCRFKDTEDFLEYISVYISVSFSGKRTDYVPLKLGPQSLDETIKEYYRRRFKCEEQTSNKKILPTANQLRRDLLVD